MHGCRYAAVSALMRASRKLRLLRRDAPGTRKRPADGLIRRKAIAGPRKWRFYEDARPAGSASGRVTAALARTAIDNAACLDNCTPAIIRCYPRGTVAGPRMLLSCIAGKNECIIRSMRLRFREWHCSSMRDVSFIKKCTVTLLLQIFAATFLYRIHRLLYSYQHTT